MSENKGHSAYAVWLIYTFRAIEKILPALKGKSKYGWVAPGLLSALVLFSMFGMGVYIDGYGIHPPAQYTGVCPLPAQISANGQKCQLVVTQTIALTNGGVTTTKSTEAAGTILYNQTKG